MKKFLMTLLLTACDTTCVEYTTPVVGRVCYTELERKALTDAIVACTNAGNPMSDEEGEDLVAQCAVSMTYAVCPERRQHVRYGCHGTERWRRTEP